MLSAGLRTDKQSPRSNIRNPSTKNGDVRPNLDHAPARVRVLRLITLVIVLISCSSLTPSDFAATDDSASASNLSGVWSLSPGDRAVFKDSLSVFGAVVSTVIGGCAGATRGFWLASFWSLHRAADLRGNIA